MRNKPMHYYHIVLNLKYIFIMIPGLWERIICKSHGMVVEILCELLDVLFMLLSCPVIQIRVVPEIPNSNMYYLNWSNVFIYTVAFIKKMCHRITYTNENILWSWLSSWNPCKCYSVTVFQVPKKEWGSV